MLLNGFAGRTVRQVERDGDRLKVEFEDGGYLYVRAKGPAGTSLKVSCMRTRCKPAHCETCRGEEKVLSE